jgi:hypothetical protein
MTIHITRRGAIAGLSALVAAPAGAQQAPKGDAADVAALEKSAVFDVTPVSGTLKETVQKGQELNWRRKGGGAEAAFQLANISIGLLRSETGGQLTLTFSCNITSLGYPPAEAAKLNIIIRSKGGAALHTAALEVPVKCTDKNQTLSPQKQDVPKELAANVFTNVNAIEIAENEEANRAGLKVQRCG